MSETDYSVLLDEVEYFDFGFSQEETEYPLNDPARRGSLIGAFETVFTGENSPYNENWDYETLDSFLDWTEEQDYEGTLAVQDGRVIGFSWGYRVDLELEEIEEKFPEELRELEEEIYDGETFMIDEVGVLPGPYRNEGIGTEVEKRTLQKAEKRDDIFRAMQRTQWSGENSGKLRLDGKLGFKAFLEGEENNPVTQEVEFVGKPGSDERVYLWKDLV